MIPELSLVIPLFNEADTIHRLFKFLNALSSSLPKKTEVIFIDDGSSDNTFQLLQQYSLKYSARIIRFSRNFGHQSALMAGLQAAQGEYTVTLDGDLQHPPSLIPKMLLLHQRGIDIVITRRMDGNKTGVFKRGTANIFYNLFNIISSRKISQNSSDFRSLNRKALNQLLQLPEKRKFLRGMVEWIGFSQIVIPYKVSERVGGSSKYSLQKMLKLAVVGITSFSTAPLYASTIAGILFFLLAVLYALYVLYIKFVTGAAIEGWASVLLVQLTIGGFICLFLGIIGLYIAAIYDEVKQRPMYIIAEEIKK